MTNEWRSFDVEAYNARLAQTPAVPYPLRARAAREAAKVPKLLESEVLPAVLDALAKHPKVGRIWRQNTGSFHVDGRYIQAAFVGCADILGWLKDGRFLAVEVKRPGKEATPEQAAFLANVRDDHGVAFVAAGVDDVMRELAQV